MPNSQAAHSGTEGVNQGTNTPNTGRHGKSEEKKSRLLHILPKLPSTDSLSNSPGPSSPGAFIFSYFSFKSPTFICTLSGITSVLDVSNVDKVIYFIVYPLSFSAFQKWGHVSDHVFVVMKSYSNLSLSVCMYLLCK